MAYLENEMKEIRDTWFNEHVVNIQGEEGLQAIDFGTPGTNDYRVKYVLSDNHIFISGDIGEAVYTLTCAATLENIKDFNLSYLTKKLQALSKPRWSFNKDLAKQQLKTYWKENEMNSYKEGKAVYHEIQQVIENSYTFEQYLNGLNLIYQNTSMDINDFEAIEEFGKEMPLHLIAYWVGLQMVTEKLEVKKETV